jgi:predicted metalloprotease with PDZ domain
MNSAKPFCTAALLAAATCAAAAPVAADPPAAPAPPAAPRAAQPGGNADLDAQLEMARRRLEQAANEVARLSAQLSTTAIDRLMPYLEPGHSIIGVQLEPAGDAAGARVREVSPEGPAAEAGIRSGDVIVALNGTALAGPEPARQVVRVMRDVKPDSKVKVRVLRDGQPRDFTLTARESPGLFADAHGLADRGFAAWPEMKGDFIFHKPFTDMELATLTPQLGSYFGSDKGVLVVRAPADRALKLEDGDVILAIDGRAPSSGSHATRILGSYQPGEKITLRIVRQHKTLNVEAALPERPAPLHQDMMRRVRPLPDDPELQPANLVIIGDNAA